MPMNESVFHGSCQPRVLNNWSSDWVGNLYFGREEQTSEKGSAVAVLYGLLMDGSLNVFEIERDWCFSVFPNSFFYSIKLVQFYGSADDRCFGGAFKEQVESAATHLLVVPAEAHWRIGTIERKNAVLRNTIEKLIDEYAVTSESGIDLILTAALQAINSSVTSKGRSPYQAVFGRLPRFPGDLFGDERALLVGADHVLAEELRAQALGVIAETRASSVIRRVLLRKTANSRQEAADILPGSLAAYWRWSKKFWCRKMLSRKLQHTPGNSPSQLWKESVYSHLAKLFFSGCVPVRCVETTVDVGNSTSPKFNSSPPKIAHPKRKAYSYRL